MTTPYKSLPDHDFWRRTVSAVPPEELDPVVDAPFAIAPTDAVVTAGSCFAQHIGAMLRRLDFNYLVTETAHPMVDAEEAKERNYGTFTARYGNVYTARQLLQLFERAYGRFTPSEDVWTEADGRSIDPFRPQIQPGGFPSLREFELDRARHFAAVRQAFETLDVLVFTFGLTEAWTSRADGAVYTICPGVSGGVFDPDRHQFHNFTAFEVVEDMISFIDALRRVNPRAKLVLTVSPVPLVASARRDAHVLAATTYSKSVLRVAAEMLTERRSDVAYFPSYEIIMSRSYSEGTYFGPDRRNVVSSGVAHVMRVFADSFADTSSPRPVRSDVVVPDPFDRMEELMETHCDEVALDG